MTQIKVKQISDKTTQLVEIAGTQTITGDKTLSGTTTISGSIGLGSSATATTQASNDNSTKVATTAYVTTAVTAVTAASGGRPEYTTVSSFPLTISAPASSVVKVRYYLNNGSSAVTVNLPAVASCDKLEIVIKLLGTGTATIDASGNETIDGALTFNLNLQNSSINLIATSDGWRIE